VQLYSAKLIIQTKLYGLRYLCYHWFFTSSVLGIFYIFQFEVWIALFIWFMMSQSKPKPLSRPVSVSTYQSISRDYKLDQRPSADILHSPKKPRKEERPIKIIDDEPKKEIKPINLGSPKEKPLKIKKEVMIETKAVVKEEEKEEVKTVIEEKVEEKKIEDNNTTIIEEVQETITHEIITEEPSQKKKLRKRKKKNVTTIQ
jgi:hypothetical protein